MGNRITFDGAIFHQIWSSFQFGYLGLNSLTVIQNGRDAKVDGVEAQVNYSAGGLSLTGAGAYTHARTSGNICQDAISVDPSPDCSGPGDPIVVPSGSRLAVTPKIKLTGTARYTWSMGSGTLHIQSSISYQGSAPPELRPDAEAEYIGNIKASTLSSIFSSAIDWSKYSAELFATNRL